MTPAQRSLLAELAHEDDVANLSSLPILKLADRTSALSRVFDVVAADTKHGRVGRLVIMHGDGTGHVYDYIYDANEDVRRWTRCERIEPVT